MLETEIIDTGIGISKERQDLLFIPFLELRTLQGIKTIDNDNIGMGLACSKAIVQHLGGDIILKESTYGLTVFGFKIPAQVKLNDPKKNLLIDDRQQPNDQILNLIMGK